METSDKNVKSCQKNCGVKPLIASEDVKKRGYV